MKFLTKIFFVLFAIGAVRPAFAHLELSKQIFRNVPYSSQYSEDGALIRSVDFKSVNALVPKLEIRFSHLLMGKKLEDRNEAHITVITPPEGKTGFFPDSIGIDQVLSTDEMIKKYKGTLQEKKFNVLCIGMQKNSKGNIVFYLVVESDEILDIRNEIARLIVDRGRTDIDFKPIENYYPHITIGYLGGDVHGVSKGPETCVEGVQIPN